MAKKKASNRSVPEDKEILNAPEAAAVLGISERLLLRLARNGEVPGKKLGREWRFLRSALRSSLTGLSDDDVELVRLLKKSGATVSKPKRKR